MQIFSHLFWTYRPTESAHIAATTPQTDRTSPQLDDGWAAVPCSGLAGRSRWSAGLTTVVSSSYHADRTATPYTLHATTCSSPSIRNAAIVQIIRTILLTSCIMTGTHSAWQYLYSKQVNVLSLYVHKHCIRSQSNRVPLHPMGWVVYNVAICLSPQKTNGHLLIYIAV